MRDSLLPLSGSLGRPRRRRVYHNPGRSIKGSGLIPIGTKLVDDIGVETLMWGSDYPHADGVRPESSKYIEQA